MGVIRKTNNFRAFNFGYFLVSMPVALVAILGSIQWKNYGLRFGFNKSWVFDSDPETCNNNPFLSFLGISSQNLSNISSQNFHY